MDSVYEVLEASEFLEIPHLKDCCEKVLKQHLNVGNCLKIRKFSKFYQMQKVTEMAESFICNNLSSVLEIEEFCDLAVDDVRSLLEMENEQQTIDECKYRSLVKWTKHDIDNRGSSFSSLFTLIDLEWLSKNFINTVVLKEKLIQDSFECLCRFVTVVADRAPVVLHENTEKHFYPSAKSSKTENILLVGGISWPQSVVKYNIDSKQFIDMPDTSVRRSCPSVVKCLGHVFLMGGRDYYGTTLISVEILDLNESTLKWEINQISMIEKRSWFASALLYDVIYCVGGRDDGNELLSSVEGYDLKVGKWFGKNKMNQGRSTHALVSTQGFEGMLFAIGGSGDGRPTNTAEVFNPNVGDWRYIPSMKTGREGLCAVVLNQEIYAIGGHDGRSNLCSVEKYNLVSQHWSDVASMREERYGGSACVVNGRIFVFGGSSFANTVQSYDPAMNEWIIEAKMDLIRSRLSVVPI